MAQDLAGQAKLDANKGGPAGHWDVIPALETPMGPPATLDSLTPPPPAQADKKYSMQKDKKGMPGSSIAALLKRYQQNHLHTASLAKNMPTPNKK